MFGKKKLIKDISANTIQTLVIQVFGLIIFLFTSRYLSKDDFGEFNWSMALGATLVAVLSFGLDLVFVKRVAIAKDVVLISGVHFFHTLVVAGIFFMLAVSVNFVLPSFKANHPLFLYVLIYLALNNIANSFKLCLTGLEAYKSLAILALAINLLKLISILYLYLFFEFNLFVLLCLYIISAIGELFLGYHLLNKKLGLVLKPVLQIKTYSHFIRESLPQLGVVLFDSALARIDWILLGVLSTALATAEYSFTYRVFELSKLPLLILAPILLTRFSQLFSGDSNISETRKHDLEQYFRLELFLVMLIPISLICIWTPLVDYFTSGKYGLVNELTYMILAVCVPIHAVINFLWTFVFVKGYLKKIMWITVFSALVNITANFILIPMYAANGAAVAFLVSTLIQMVLYLFAAKGNEIMSSLTSCFLPFINAFIGIAAAKLLTQSAVISFCVAIGIYLLMTFFTKQIRLEKMKLLLSHKN